MRPTIPNSLLKLTTSCQLVVNLLFEQKHRFSSKIVEQAEELAAPKQAVEALMAIDVVLRAAENTFATSIDFL